jgi:hypothetical protein
MSRKRMAAAAAAFLLVLTAQTIRADVRADQKTRVEFGGMLGHMVNFFGGKGAKEGVVSSVVVVGDRKATMNEQTGQIVDLAEEKIYDLDLKKKNYKVTTFAELRRRMEEAQKKAEEEAKNTEGHEAAPEPTPAPDEKQMQVDVDVKNTGEKKSINGFDTSQVIMTITLHEKGKTLQQSGGIVTTSDMWLAPRIAAMKEVVDFDMRYAQKLYGGMFAAASAEQMAAAMALYPMLKQAMGRMTTEGAKIDGTSILTTVKIDAVKSEEELARQSAAASEQKPAGLGGLLGGLAKKATKKGESADNADPARATIMTSTNEVLKVTPSVSADDVAIPMGFRESK